MGAGTLGLELLRGSVEGDGLLLLAAGEGAGGGCGFGGGDLAEDKEFYEGADEDYDGELAEEETLCEREAGWKVSRKGLMVRTGVADEDCCDGGYGGDASEAGLISYLLVLGVVGQYLQGCSCY